MELCSCEIPLSGSTNNVSGGREEHAVLHVRADEKGAVIFLFTLSLSRGKAKITSQGREKSPSGDLLVTESVP